MINRIKNKPKLKKKSGFVYKPRSASSVKERAEQTGGKFDSPFKQGFDTWRPKVGDNSIRILPPTWDDFEHYGMDLYVHSYIGPDNSTYLCPYKMQKKHCPVCDAAKEAKDAGETDEAKALGVKKIVACWILDRSDADHQPTIYAMSWTMDRDISDLSQNKKTGSVLLIDNPDEGYDVSFRRIGQGLKTRYGSVLIDRDPSPISDDNDVQEEVLKFIQENPIPSVLKYYSADYLEKVLSGESEEKDEDLDDEEDEGVKKPKKKRPVEEEEEEEETVEEEEETVEEEEEEEDPPPKKKKKPAEEEEEEEEDPPPKKKKKKPVEEEEEEEEEETGEEEEEEEEPPKKKKPRRGSDEEEEEEEEETTEEEEEEEEEDPPPKKKTKVKPKTKRVGRR